MYDKEALKRLIKKKGMDTVIEYFLSDKISEATKDILIQEKIFVDGFLNLSHLYYLAAA